MKQLEEEFGLDREIGTETDDEENEAERDCHDHDNESDATGPSRVPSHETLDLDPTPRWPQSYRQSMDIYTSVTPSVSFLKSSSFALSSDKKSSDVESALFRPLISSTSVDREEVPTSIPPVKLSVTSVFRTSISELPQPQQCSYIQSVLNAINALCGIGILSTPYALKEGGWLSILILFTFGTITCYTGILLKRCLESSSELQTYPDIGEAAFGLIGRIFIAAILYVELYFLIMMSDSLSSSFPNAQIDIAGVHLDSYQICAIVSTIVILPTCWLRNLSLLSYISVGGVMTLVVVVLCLLWVGIRSEVGFHPAGRSLNFTNLPITIGIYSFCYGSHSVFPNIYSSMQDPSRFPSVLIIRSISLNSVTFIVYTREYTPDGFVVAGLLYAGVAVCGFLMFGEAVSPQFTLNLPKRLIASNIAGWSVVLAPLTKYALSITPVALAMEELLPSAQLRSHTTPILIRSSLVMSTLIVTLTVPYFGFVMAFIGSFLVMLVSVVLPCACYMRLDRERLTKLQITTCSVIMVVGVSCAIIGTCSAVARMST